MNSLKDADFYATFPPALKKDEKMVALGRLIADELHQTVEQTKKNIIYANINELSETWLDVLAYDLQYKNCSSIYRNDCIYKGKSEDKRKSITSWNFSD